MPDDLLSRAVRVTDRKAAAALCDPLRRRLVLLLAGREQSAGELASVMGVELKRLHYHLAALEKLGLVMVASRRARAGRPIKLYRAVADAFFVPADAACALPSDALVAELRVSQARLADPASEGLLYHSNDQGDVIMRPVKNKPADRVAVADYWRRLQLSPVEARRLVSELDACLKAAMERSRGATKTYLVHLAFAPKA